MYTYVELYFGQKWVNIFGVKMTLLLKYVTLCTYKNYNPSISQDKFHFIQHFQWVFFFIL